MQLDSVTWSFCRLYNPLNTRKTYTFAYVDYARVFLVGHEYKIKIGALFETYQNEANAQQSR